MQTQTGPVDMPHIPAMTTEAERELYYRLAKDGASKGAVVELGAWLGASSAWIAAGMRDSGTGKKAHVYDRFLSKPGHAAKVQAFYASHGGGGEMPMGDCERAFRDNLGPLIEHVEVHRGEIAQIQWDGGPISVLITDAPKRVPEISAVLTRLGPALLPGAVMAWQDFCHFPSYEIPASLYLLRDHWRFIEAVVPGTTLAFEVTLPWGAAAVSKEALALSQWAPDQILHAWDNLSLIVPVEKLALFRCGAALFLCDIGEPVAAVNVLADVFAHDAPAILPKWRYLREQRADFLKRYAPLFHYLARQGAFEMEGA